MTAQEGQPELGRAEPRASGSQQIRVAIRENQTEPVVPKDSQVKSRLLDERTLGCINLMSLVCFGQFSQNNDVNLAFPNFCSLSFLNESFENFVVVAS